MSSRIPALFALAALAVAPGRARAEAEEVVTRETEHFTFVYRSRYWGSIRNTVAVAESARAQMIEDFGVEDASDRVEVRFARNVEEMRRRLR